MISVETQSRTIACYVHTFRKVTLDACTSVLSIGHAPKMHSTLPGETPGPVSIYSRMPVVSR